MKKLLFVCSRNKLRSPTAEQIFSKRSDLEVMSAGLNRDSVYQISSEDMNYYCKKYQNTLSQTRKDKSVV